MPGGTVVSRLLSFLIRSYRYGLSPLLGMHCRFHPTCSEYALEALERHGTVRGMRLALARLGRCHPWHPGGHDPVP
ncbi:MAG TPA: membrane protein insertion efficiency factor YidD [Burkholderiales bacterium]|nr:membrane protein insertion efficiency factor YidD [Burkholderiales bacterium]